MKVISRFFAQSYYRARILFTFSFISLILLVLAFQTSYQLVRRIYIEQLSSQVITVTTMAASQMDRTFLHLLNPTGQKNAVYDYYQNYVKQLSRTSQIQPVFIFNDQYVILSHSDSVSIGTTYPQLILSRKEIQDLQPQTAVASLPFKGEDGNWYLWGFYRLSENHWLGIQESADRLNQIDELKTYFLWIGLTALFLTIFASLIVVRMILQPIRRLTEFSRRLGKSEFNTPRPSQIRGELSPLADAMDKMREELSEVQKEKEKILAQIAHEIRNPLGSVELLAGLVKEDPALDKKNADFIQKILQEIVGLKSLISAYLNYSKPMPPQSERVDVAALFHQIADIFSNQLEKKQLRLLIRAELVSMEFDPLHLRQILINLVSNSIEALSADGEITLKAFRNKNQLVISVTDNGNGISEENQKHLFEPFFTSKENGTGLGLAISKKLCEENQASLLFNNEHEQGCTFSILKESFDAGY